MAAQLPAKRYEERFQGERRAEVELLEGAPGLADELAGALGAGEAGGRSVLFEHVAAAPGSNSGSVYTERATSSNASRLRALSGSRSRAARSSRPDASRASEAASSGSSPGARASISSRIARSESRVNGTSWQRERIVSGNGPRSSATRMMTTYGGGSSRSLR